jgi:hypothetical protein
VDPRLGAGAGPARRRRRGAARAACGRGPAATRTLLELYLRVRYGSEQPGPDEVATARTALAGLERDLAEQNAVARRPRRRTAGPAMTRRNPYLRSAAAGLCLGAVGMAWADAALFGVAVLVGWLAVAGGILAAQAHDPAGRWPRPRPQVPAAAAGWPGSPAVALYGCLLGDLVLAGPDLAAHTGPSTRIEAAVLLRAARSVLPGQLAAQALLLGAVRLRHGLGTPSGEDWPRAVALVAALGAALLVLPPQWRHPWPGRRRRGAREADPERAGAAQQFLP